MQLGLIRVTDFNNLYLYLTVIIYLYFIEYIAYVIQAINKSHGLLNTVQ